MNHKQKLGYMALGAGILAIGIIIGQWGTQDIEAQNNGVFDEITCRSLKVVDENGKMAIELSGGGEFDNHVTLYNQWGRGILLNASKIDNRVSVYDYEGARNRNENEAILLVSTITGESALHINSDQRRITLATREDNNTSGVAVVQKEHGVLLLADENTASVSVIDTDRVKWEAP